jgi:hypothetical protein
MQAERKYIYCIFYFQAENVFIYFYVTAVAAIAAALSSLSSSEGTATVTIVAMTTVQHRIAMQQRAEAEQ